MDLTILICTHNRVDLLEKTLASLNQAARPSDCQVEILVVANACSDGTTDFLDRYPKNTPVKNFLPLRWIEEKTPGKSHALNRAIPTLVSDIVAMVDDDHRIDPDFLTNICKAIQTYPQATLFCGRILPDWNGSEPAWVHDAGRYRIYPLPVPRYDYGDQPQPVVPDGLLPFPGGGNLFLRREVFDRIGDFSTELGPHGHDLGGGEDSEFVLRALTAGEKIQYVPDVVQHHYVDLERFELRYILQKSYQRSRSVSRVHHKGQSIPLYMWRKLAEYLASAVFSASWPRTRFFLVRLAATVGEIRGISDKPLAGKPSRQDTYYVAPGLAPLATVMGLALASALAIAPTETLIIGAATVASVAAAFTLILLLKSITDFSRTGPQIREEIQRYYSIYSLYAVGRLACWGAILSGLMATTGVAIYTCLSIALGIKFNTPSVIASAICGVVLLTFLQFCRQLLYLPATIAASSHYRLSRFYPLWQWLSPSKLRGAQWALIALGGAAALLALAKPASNKDWPTLLVWTALAAIIVLSARLLSASREAVPGKAPPGSKTGRPNIVMIGSDTLRADRLQTDKYHRHLTPHLDALAQQGTHFTQCYVPCARTAPSLISLLTGTWPHTHGIRDNFVGDDELILSIPALPELLSQTGYRTAVVGDWSAADMGKFELGFQKLDLPKDQWSLKYLIRQGPKDLRLFLSLFTHNRFGKHFLPELYYLAGIPLTREIGRDARAMISDLAAQEQPFFLNIFMATTHPPFGSEYPYYTLYSDPAYRGESKFVMARLRDPFEIIRSQGDSKKEFDLDQIIDLYDGCVKSFDDEVARIVAHIKACGVEENTVIVIYSDHGMEFFEHDTWGQGNSVMGDHSARVPLIIKDPRKSPGGTVSRITRTVDIAPTLLDLLGMEKPPQMEGVSLAPYMENCDINLGLTAHNETGIWLTTPPGMPANHLHYPDLPDLLEVPDKRNGTLAIKPEYQKIIVRAKDRMIRTERWKFTYQPMIDGEIHKLFDLENDPGCYSNVLDLHPEVAEDLRQKLRAWMEPDLAIAIQAADKNGTTG